jgi:hypothetical protein
MRTKDETHSAKFDKLLRGKKINSCRYMTREEADQFGWYKRPLIIVFTDESYIILQSDDEGNEGGAAFYEDIPGGENYNTIYTI